jgi:hypothetical protein
MRENGIMKTNQFVKRDGEKLEGRLRMRWMDGVQNNLRSLGMDNWRADMLTNYMELSITREATR